MERIRIKEDGKEIDTKPGFHQGGDWLAPIRHGYDPFVAVSTGAPKDCYDYAFALVEKWGMVCRGSVDADMYHVCDLVVEHNLRKNVKYLRLVEGKS